MCYECAGFRIDGTDEDRSTCKRIEEEAYETAKEEVDAALAYAPNNALFGSSSYRIPFPTGLWIYNAL